MASLEAQLNNVFDSKRGIVTSTGRVDHYLNGYLCPNHLARSPFRTKRFAWIHLYYRPGAYAEKGEHIILEI